MIDRCAQSKRLMRSLAEQGIDTTAYPGFMEDQPFGSVAWSLLHKTAANLGPNGWSKYLLQETLLCLSVQADHLEMVTPPYAHLLVDTDL